MSKKKKHKKQYPQDMDLDGIVEDTFKPTTETNTPYGSPEQDASEWCIMFSKILNYNIATSYTFNPDDPSMPYCKSNQNCKHKIDNYGERPCCLYMHNKYKEEIKND